MPGEQMHVARFLRARLPQQHGDKRRIMLDQSLQRRLHVIQMLETEHPLSPPAQLARSLRSAQQEHTQDRRLATGEVENLLNAMFVLRDPAVRPARRTRKPMAL